MHPIRALKRLEPIASKASQDLTVQAMPKEYYSIKEASKILKCSKRHVDRLIDLGELSGVMDISLPNSSRQCLRIPSKSVHEFQIRNSALR